MANVEALFLPPAPHSRDFFDRTRAALADIPTEAATYPGYGDRPRGEVSITAYAKSLLSKNTPDVLVGFHTGCLVALEMALQSQDALHLILIDVPFFDAETKAGHAKKLDPNDPKMDAFRAAFRFDAKAALSATTARSTAIATNSSLFEPTKKASGLITDCVFLERRDIEKPAMDHPEMAVLLRQLILA